MAAREIEGEDMDRTHIIRLAGYDEARAAYVEQLLDIETLDAARRNRPGPTEDRAREIAQDAAAIREAAEHADDFVEIHYEQTFGTTLDMRSAVARGDLGDRTIALVRNSIVRWQIGELRGESVTDTWVRGLGGDLGSWIADEIQAHYEEVRRAAPKATARSTSRSSQPSRSRSTRNSAKA